MRVFLLAPFLTGFDVGKQKTQRAVCPVSWSLVSQLSVSSWWCSRTFAAPVGLNGARPLRAWLELAFEGKSRWYSLETRSSAPLVETFVLEGSGVSIEGAAAVRQTSTFLRPTGPGPCFNFCSIKLGPVRRRCCCCTLNVGLVCCGK